MAEHFADVGWQAPALLAALRDAPELYFDTIGQIRLGHWSAGRVVLLGDAAWCTGPGGNGTGHAMLGAYTLAGNWRWPAATTRRRTSVTSRSCAGR